MNTPNEEKDRLNHQAYMDVLDFQEPSMPDNETYMACYRSWRPLQKFPGDDYLEEVIL